MEGLSWSEIFEFFGFAIAATLIAGAICPLVGTFLLVRRTGFYGIALPQFAAAGTVLGFVLLPAWLTLFAAEGDVVGPVGADDQHRGGN